MGNLPEGAPANGNEAYAYLATVTTPTIEDLKLMVFLEASGKKLYEDIASGFDNDGVKALLAQNGREELAHAHRVSRAIGMLTGTDFPVPVPDQNPYVASGFAPPGADATFLATLADAEFGGEVLYETWAGNSTDTDVASLFRQNGREEARHGDRLHEAIRLLGGA